MSNGDDVGFRYDPLTGADPPPVSPAGTALDTATTDADAGADPDADADARSDGARRATGTADPTTPPGTAIATGGDAGARRRQRSNERTTGRRRARARASPAASPVPALGVATNARRSPVPSTQRSLHRGRRRRRTDHAARCPGASPATSMNPRALGAWALSGVTIALATGNPVYRVLVLLCALNVAHRVAAAGRVGSRSARSHCSSRPRSPSRRRRSPATRATTHSWCCRRASR